MIEKLYTTADLADWYALGVQHERERAAVAGYEHELFWDRDAEQLHRDRKAETMRLYLRAAQRFWERELGKPYVPFEGVRA